MKVVLVLAATQVNLKKKLKFLRNEKIIMFFKKTLTPESQVEL